jgi:GDP-L-fucose synthase
MSFWKDKAVLVTGGTGFVGSHFVRQLLEAGGKVSVPVHRKKPRAWDPKQVNCFPADLEDPEACRRALAGQEIVIHAAGAVSAAGVTASSNPMSPITANLILTSNILEAAWAVKSEKILIFGSSTGYPETNHPVSENEMWSGQPHPSYFGYGWMRRYLEKMAEYTQLRGGRGIALVRPTATYGPFDDFNPKTAQVIPSLIAKFLESSKNKKFVNIWGDGSAKRDFIFSEDAAEAIMRIMTVQKAFNYPINLGAGRAISIKKLALCLKEIINKNIYINWQKHKPTGDSIRVLDTKRLKEILPNFKTTPLKNGLIKTVDWYIENKLK